MPQPAHQTPSVAIFAPHPILTVTLELEGSDRDSIHFHAGGQGVWAASMVRCFGATPVLCGFIGGESGSLLLPLLERICGPHAHLVQTASASGCYVTDRRSGERVVLAAKVSDPPSRHELDELVSLACAQAIACGCLVVTNPFPGDALPLEVYRDLVADARAAGCRVLVDLSTPRLDSALEGRPELVKINDWELAEFVNGPVSTPATLLAGARALRERGAGTAIVTRGEQPAMVVRQDGVWRLRPPRFEHGFREGCGDAMMGAIAAACARGEQWDHALVLGAAAGAANFLRRGLGSASREVVEDLAPAVALEPWPGTELADGSSGG
jgi:1-phosphofructokinase